MTVFKTAYDTTACEGFVTRKTAEALQVAFINGQLTGHAGDSIIHTVQGGGSVVDAVPAFAHPMLLELDHKPVLAVDLRSVGRWDPNQHEFVIRNEIERALIMRRAQLNEVWLGAHADSLKSLSQLPMTVYASWLNESIAKRFALDAREQLTLAILACVFYNSLFTNEAELAEEDKNRLAGQIARVCRASAEDVFAVLDQVTVIPNIHAFCSKAMDVTGSIRLRDLNVGLVWAILGGTWYGVNAREVVAVALEHPPTWIAVLLAAYNERSFKNSGITKITERPSNKDNGGNFLRSVLNLVDSAV
jgi:hypothetical protein